MWCSLSSHELMGFMDILLADKYFVFFSNQHCSVVLSFIRMQLLALNVYGFFSGKLTRPQYFSAGSMKPVDLEHNSERKSLTTLADSNYKLTKIQNQPSRGQTANRAPLFSSAQRYPIIRPTIIRW